MILSLKVFCCLRIYSHVFANDYRLCVFLECRMYVRKYRRDSFLGPWVGRKLVGGGGTPLLRIKHVYIYQSVATGITMGVALGVMMSVATDVYSFKT